MTGDLMMPVHDPPVAWYVNDNNALAQLGIPVIACPAFAPGAKGRLCLTAVSPRYMDPEPIILPSEPGRRP